MRVRWIVELGEGEREELEELLRGGTLGVRKAKRALTLLRSDECWSAERIADALGIGTSTVYRTRERYVEGGLKRALNEDRRDGATRKLSAKHEATLIALACSDAPDGRAKWTMQLLADELVALTDLDSVSADTVGRRLKEKKLKPWQHKMWCIAKIDAEYVARMEDILDLYAQPYDPDFPVVNFDETPVQLIGETRIPLPAEPGRPARVDYEYRRHGVANLFLAFERYRGWRNVDVTAHRTKDDFAEQMRELVDVHFPNARKIRVVLDNLNTHRIAALYERFEPEEAQRIASKLEFHFTPKHASWLNMVEIEIGVLSKQCLDQRISSVDVLSTEIAAWQQARNDAQETIDWLFDVEAAREKFEDSYPTPTSRTEVEAPEPAEATDMDDELRVDDGEVDTDAAPRPSDTSEERTVDGGELRGDNDQIDSRATPTPSEPVDGSHLAQENPSRLRFHARCTHALSGLLRRVREAERPPRDPRAYN